MNPDELIGQPTNAADRKSLRRKKERDLIATLEDETALRFILTSQEGRRFLILLFEICGYDEEYLQPNHALMCGTAGRRQVARQIRNRIREIHPDGFKLWGLFDADWQAHRYPPPDPPSRR